jgi:hypothetical protein
VLDWRPSLTHGIEHFLQTVQSLTPRNES